MERSKSSILEDLWKHLEDKSDQNITQDVKEFLIWSEGEYEIQIPPRLAEGVAEQLVKPLQTEFSLGSGYAGILENIKSILQLLVVNEAPGLSERALEDLQAARVTVVGKILASSGTSSPRIAYLEQAKQDVAEVYRIIEHLNRYTPDKNPKAALMFLSRFLEHRLDSQQRPEEVGPPDLKKSLEALKVVSSELQQGFVETWLENNKDSMEEQDGVLYYTMETRNESVEKANRDTFYAIDFFDVTLPASIETKELKAAAPLVIQAYCEDELTQSNGPKEGYSLAKAVSQVRSFQAASSVTLNTGM